MKILYLCHRFPYPPNRGGKIRPFNMIRHLSRRHEVVVVSLARSEQEAKAGEGLASYCARYRMARTSAYAAALRMVALLPTPVPSSMGYFGSSALRRYVSSEAAVDDFDLVFVHCSSVAPYAASLRGVRKILDFGDMDSQKWLTYARTRRFPLALGYLVEGLKLRRSEARLAARFDVCTCTTLAEMDTLKSYGAARRVDWFPNGVDAEYFAPAGETHDPDSVCFVGRMDYYPNQECMIDFCRNTLPLLRRRRPDLKLTIIGAEPSPAIRRLGRIPGVTVTGSVADVRPFARAAAVNVAPLNIARGTQNKILEAMAMGIPTVASAASADGVDAVPGVHFLTASTPGEYAEAILRVLEDPAERRRLAQAGRARMLSHHSWDHSMSRMDRIIEECMAIPPAIEEGNGRSGVSARSAR